MNPKVRRTYVTVAGCAMPFVALFALSLTVPENARLPTRPADPTVVATLEIHAVLDSGGGLAVTEWIATDLADPPTRTIAPSDVWERWRDRTAPPTSALVSPEHPGANLPAALITTGDGPGAFTSTYRIPDAVEVARDTAILPQRWSGEETVRGTAWTVRIDVPDGVGDLHPWIAPDTTVLTDPGGVTFAGLVERDGDPIETIVVIPSDRFTDNEILIDLRPQFDRSERLWMPTNAPSEPWLDLTRPAAWARTALTYSWPFLLIVAVAAFLAVWRHWGRDPDGVDEIGPYYREIPDDPPAVAASLLSWGEVGPEAFGATILDLAHRGWFSIDDTGRQGWRGRRVEFAFSLSHSPPDDHLLPFERALLGWMFPPGVAESTQQDILDRTYRDQLGVVATWRSFEFGVLTELERRDYLVAAHGVAFRLHCLIVGTVGLAATLAFLVGATLPMAMLALGAMVLGPLGVLHESRTADGLTRTRQWQGLRRYLRDMSTLDEAVVGDMALWDRYLSAAVALKVADRLGSGLARSFPDPTLGPSAHVQSGSHTLLQITAMSERIVEVATGTDDVRPWETTDA